ncbi:MAG TPA: heavy metal-responsive transcriptional regulator [Candidatus Methylomirabilis sp.]|jgi:DNA-binding transcriptional MerR regulator|nr:heavy metal-responsive transcriptional regulator [Candidatus Methylomirabilis sp.]
MTRNQLFIGTLAKQAGVSPKTIRYYEAVGVLPPAQRGENRYRLYPKETVELLEFITKAKALGFTLSEIKDIVGVRRQGHQPCAHVRSLVEQKIVDLDRMLAEFLTLRKRLKRLLVGWKERAEQPSSQGVVCPQIEGERIPSRGSR